MSARHCYADVLLIDRQASGVEHVLVNGVAVLADGEHTGAKPGRVVRGPGWDGKTTATRHRLEPLDQVSGH